MIQESRIWDRRIALLLGLLLMGLQEAKAATCTLNVPGLSFGSYDVFSSSSLDSAGTISISCDMDTTYTISLGPGGGSYALRTMLSGTHTLSYNLYIDAARTIIWGDGTGSTGTLTNTAASANHTVYGRIPARQNAYIGSYSDAITVTLNF
jgi:spore coat protein U-like protein